MNFFEITNRPPGLLQYLLQDKYLTRDLLAQGTFGPPTLRRPSRPTRAPPPSSPSVRFKPDRPRQPELSRKLEERNPQPLQPPLLAGRSAPTLKPYQLKPKRGKVEPPVEWEESPTTNPKKLKRMKKKLDDLNRKIRHSRKKHDGLIHKRNSLRKSIESLKRGTKPEPVPELEWNFREKAFDGDYRSYRVNGRPKMDIETFFSQIRERLRGSDSLGMRIELS